MSNQPRIRIIQTNPWKDIDQSIEDLIDKTILEFNPEVLDDDIPDLLDDPDQQSEAIDYLIEKLKKLKEE